MPGIDRYEIVHTTLYRVHQRVATTFRKGRAFLIGDAAHINNPLGGMGMNGGIHDAINLTDRLAEVWHGSKGDAELDRFDKQRRLVTKEYVEKQSIQNKKNLETPGTEFRDRLAAIAADPGKTRDYLLAVSMISSLRRAQELGDPALRYGAYSGRFGVNTSRLITGSSPSTSPQCVTPPGMTTSPPGPRSCVSSPM